MLPATYYQHWETIGNIKDSYGSTLLLRAANDGMSAVASCLLSLVKEYDRTIARDGQSVASYVNEANDMGWTALLLASQNGFYEIVTAIVEASPGIHIDNPTRSAHLTPLMLAATHGHVQVVQYLLHHKASPWTVATSGMSCLEMVKSARLKLGLPRMDVCHDEYQVATAEKAQNLAACLDRIYKILHETTHGETVEKLI